MAINPVFHVGDRVEFTGGYSTAISPGDIGTILKINPPDELGVRWDEYFPVGHNLGGLCENGHGWWVSRESVSPYEEENLEPADATKLKKFLS